MEPGDECADVPHPAVDVIDDGECDVSPVHNPTGTISGLKANTKYYAKVRTIETDGTNLSLYSSAINVTTSSTSAVTAASYTTSPSTSASAASTTPANSTAKNVPASKEYTFKGHGYGHGIGMGQYGAEGGARAGASYSKILSTYYPGTALGTKGGSIRVLITGDSTNSVMVESRSGLTLRYISSNKTLALPTTVSGNKVVRWSIEPLSSDPKKSVLRYRTTGAWTTYKNTTWTGAAQFEASTLSLVMPAGANRTYRTALRSVQPSSGSSSRDTVNVLSLENYTRGVVAREMPASWHAEALKAQSVAARTYGVRSISSTRYYDICDTTSCQVYGGVSAETSATDSADRGNGGQDPDLRRQAGADPVLVLDRWLLVGRFRGLSQGGQRPLGRLVGQCQPLVDQDGQGVDDPGQVPQDRHPEITPSHQAQRLWRLGWPGDLAEDRRHQGHHDDQRRQRAVGLRPAVQLVRVLASTRGSGSKVVLG